MKFDYLHGNRYERIIAVLLLVHFTALCMIKYVTVTDPEIFWLCNISLALAAVALFLQSNFLVFVAITNIFFFHILWYVDIASFLTTGTFSLGVASYLKHADLLTWITTSHHFYLLPLLLFIVIHKHSSFPPVPTLLASVFILSALVIISRYFTNNEMNINYAYRIELLSESPAIRWVNQHDPFAYLTLGISLISLGIFFPTIVLLNRLTASRTIRKYYQKTIRNKCVPQ